jgi:hypothetical protein
MASLKVLTRDGWVEIAEVTFEKGLERDLWEMIDRRLVEKNLS